MEIALVYMVAGMSSRFGGKPKHFAQIGPNNETMLEVSLSQALKTSFTKIIFIIRKETLEDFKKLFSDSYNSIPIFYAIQEFDKEKRDKPWGTTDALCSALNLINCPFVVCNGDDIYGEQAFQILINHLKNNQGCATIGYKLGNALSESGGVNRGIFKTNEDNEMVSITETFDITKENLKEKNLSENSLSSQNIFALFPETIKELNKILNNFKQIHQEDRKIECLLPKELDNLIKNKKIKIKVYHTSEKPIGITNPADEETAKEQLKNLIKNNEPTSP